MLNWTWLLFLPACLGVPLGAVGVVVRLCEWGWEKPAGSLGSRWLLGWAILLSAPAAWVLGMLLVDQLR